MYGGLAAVFPYGRLPAGLEEAVGRCVSAQGLTLLSPAERDHLEAHLLYPELF